MKKSTRPALTTGLWFCLVSLLLPGAIKADEVAVTVYNDNFAVIRETRPLELANGINTIRFTDVAAQIDPTSVSFKCIADPAKVSILEQNYEYDLVNTESLLQRYIDKEVSIWVKGSGQGSPSPISGILNAAVGNDLIILNQATGQLEIIDRGSVERILLAKRPDDLITRPTLVWMASSKLTGSQPCQITYTTGGMSWKADYTAILSQDEKTLDFSGWVTIDNRSGAAYKEARLKLIAGDVRRVQPPQPMYKARRAGLTMEMAAPAMDGGFEEKSFMDYHMYTLGRASTLNNNQTKQIEFVAPVSNIAVEKKYIYQTGVEPWMAQNDNNKVMIKLEFKNTEENKLGLALPKGKVRTFKADQADGSLEFVGEDNIDHTPRKETIKLYIGDAFDVIGETKSLDQKQRERWRETRREITLKNRKKEAATVFVDEKMAQGRTWTISANSQAFDKTDAWTARFKVELPADSEKTVAFTLTETW